MLYGKSLNNWYRCPLSAQGFDATKPLLSPVPSLLHSNATPTGAEAADIRGAVLEVEKRLLSFDEEIASALEQRRRERQSRQENIGCMPPQGNCES